MNLIHKIGPVLGLLSTLVLPMVAIGQTLIVDSAVVDRGDEVITFNEPYQRIEVLNGGSLELGALTWRAPQQGFLAFPSYGDIIVDGPGSSLEALFTQPEEDTAETPGIQLGLFIGETRVSNGGSISAFQSNIGAAVVDLEDATFDCEFALAVLGQML